MNHPASDVAFSDSVKALQTARGSRAAYGKSDFETVVDERLAAFLTHIDTAFLASASKDGQPYVQHRGGPKGFIRAIDEHTLGLVDFAGNRQYVSSGNLLENDRVCLFLMDYERRRRIKVWGTARMVPATPELIEQLAMPGYKARIEQVLLITVTAWDVNCPQHIPQKIDAAVAIAMTARIEELERENAELRARLGRGSP